MTKRIKSKAAVNGKPAPVPKSDLEPLGPGWDHQPDVYAKLRANAFADVGGEMYDVIERLIWHAIQEALSWYTDGTMKPGRLEEVRNALVEGAALSIALLDLGEAGR